MKNTKLIGVSGKARHGKDTVSNMIQEIVSKEGTRAYEIRAFGDAVKNVAAAMTGLPHPGNWETTEDKEAFLGPEWDTVNEDGETVRMTRRKFLTTLGTDAVTSNLHINAWINMTFRDYDASESTWIVKDVRFFNELKRVRRFEGVTIRVHDPRKPSKDMHASETQLDEVSDWDFFIVNDGTFEELETKVRQVLTQLKLI